MKTYRHIAVALLGASISNTAAQETVGYNTDIRPILSDKCFLCHGPDAGTREPKNHPLRLDVAEDAYAELKSSPGKFAIVPGSPEKSEIWRHINLPPDHDDIMPPAKFNLTLSVHEKELIGEWIKQGAQYEPHWSFVNLPETIEIPKIKNPQWAKNPIDHFVAAKHESEKLTHSPEAEPVRWLRRVTFDLIGLPPTLAQIDAFEKDLQTNGEDAYRKVVEQLLETPEYAENMAIPWLDAARYADTWGYNADNTFTSWPYRDWVIKAFQQDMPYNRFVTENIAGDLIPNATQDQKLATAFNRLNRMTNEGGSSFLEFRVDGVSDRVNTVGTAFLGLTMECAKCHDHKYDPITAKDYFQLYAFFNSINESGLYNHQNISPPPSLLIPTEEQEQKLAELQAQAKQLADKLDTLHQTQRPQFITWKKNTLHPSKPTPEKKAPAGQEQPKKKTAQAQPKSDHPGNTFLIREPLKPEAPAPKPLIQKALQPLKISLADQTGFFDFNKSSKRPLDSRIELNGKKVKGSHRKTTFSEGPKGYGTALALDGDYGFAVGNFFKINRDTPFSIGLWIKDTIRNEKHSVVLQRAFGTEVGYNGVELALENGYLIARIYRHWPDNGIGIRSIKQLPKNQWKHLTWTYDASSTAAGLRLYLNGLPIETTIIGDQIYKSTDVRTYQSGNFTVGVIFRGRGFKGGHVDELTTFQRALTPIEVKHLAGTQDINESLKNAPDDELYPYYLGNHHTEYRKTLQQYAEARKAITKAEDKLIEVPVMEELETPRPAHLLDRGEYNAPRNEETLVQRDSLSFLLPFPEDAPRDRLGLAQWLTLPNHPLTSRVYVNRIWQQLWGEGLVRTSENFGLQGDLPTHPELLDWLARDFVKHGWSTKRLITQIVLSATYRQKSALTPTLESMDIENKLLARGPSHRLSGEQIRDAALASSGLLIRKQGGPPVAPFDPVNRRNSRHPRNNHRRSLYTYWKRTKPQNNILIFDKPPLEVCSVKRTLTNSPAQALVTLNDPQFVEAARHLATTILKEQADDQARIKIAWRKVTSREPNPKELEILTEILNESRTYFSDKAENAAKFIKTGFTRPPKGIDAREAAALTIMCQAVYNSDAAIWKR